MKHGRRHKTLKEQTYVARFHQGAEGYASEYRAIDVAEPTTPPAPPPSTDVPVGLALGRKAQRQLKRAGVDPLE